MSFSQLLISPLVMVISMVLGLGPRMDRVRVLPSSDYCLKVSCQRPKFELGRVAESNSRGNQFGSCGESGGGLSCRQGATGGASA